MEALTRPRPSDSSVFENSPESWTQVQLSWKKWDAYWMYMPRRAIITIITPTKYNRSISTWSTDCERSGIFLVHCERTSAKELFAAVTSVVWTNNEYIRSVFRRKADLAHWYNMYLIMLSTRGVRYLLPEHLAKYSSCLLQSDIIALWWGSIRFAMQN